MLDEAERIPSNSFCLDSLYQIDVAMPCAMTTASKVRSKVRATKEFGFKLLNHFIRTSYSVLIMHRHSQYIAVATHGFDVVRVFSTITESASQTTELNINTALKRQRPSSYCAVRVFGDSTGNRSSGALAFNREPPFYFYYLFLYFLLSDFGAKF